VKDAQGNTIGFAYDSMNRLTTITYPDSSSTQFAYDYRGRRISVTDQNGKTTSYAYDDADRLPALRSIPAALRRVSLQSAAGGNPQESS